MCQVFFSFERKVNRMTIVIYFFDCDMYLKSSSFSNLLSFSAHDHSDLRHTIVRSGGDEDCVNIVIGPNGS